MADPSQLSDLSGIANARKPKPTFSGSTPEDKLMTAYGLARQALIETLPPGTTIDQLAAQSARDMVGMQLVERKPQVKASLDTNTDLSEENGIALTHNDSRQYYLSKYIIGVDGLGIYASGYGRKMAADGAFPGDYEQSIQDKIDIFSEIIYAQDTGQLPALVNAEKYATQTSGSPSSRIVIAGPGVTVTAPEKASGGLGMAPIPWGWIAVTVVGLVACGVMYFLGTKQIETNAALTREMCNKLIESGDKGAAESCINIQKEALNLGPLGNIVGGKTMEQIGKYVFVGGLLILGVMFLPQITGSLMQTQMVMQQHRAARLAAANRRRYR